MPILSLGPLELRFTTNDTGNNWSNVVFAFVTNRDKGGFSTRETAVRAGFKSEHLLEALGEEDTSSTAVVNGTTYHGRRSKGLDGNDHVLTAEQVAAKAEYLKAMRESRLAAQRAAKFAAGQDPSDDPSAPQAPA